MLKKIARIAAQAALTVLMIAAAVKVCPAVVIEGYTPSGNFKSVGVTENGELAVQNDTATAQHIIVDTGTATVAQGPAGVSPWLVRTVGGIAVTVQASTAAHVQQNQFATSTLATVIFPADANRVQGVICNTDPGATIWLGDSSVSQINGLPLLAGNCFSPDVPASFQGDLYGVSSATSHGAYIYFKP